MNRVGTPLSQVPATLRRRVAHISAPPVSSGSPGRRKAGSLPSLRGPVHATRRVQTRARPSRQDRHSRT